MSYSRPLYGVSYLNLEGATLVKKSLVIFSSPLRGLLSQYDYETAKEMFKKLFSSPLRGLLSQSCPLHLPKHKAFIPHLRGKPANERNLNIKLVYNILKA